jgi:hypothetical protein
MKKEKPKPKPKLKLLTKEEIEKMRIKAYKYIDLTPNK